MNIQSNINQTLSLAGMLIAMNPTVKARAETREALSKLSREEQVLSKQYEHLAFNPDMAETVESRMTDLAQEQFEAAPSEESYSKYLQTRYGESPLLSPKVSALVNRFRQIKTEARESVAAKQEQKRASRRKFTDYLQDEPVLGGKFSELDSKLQKKIADTYSKSEKQKIMNRKDAMNE